MLKTTTSVINAGQIAGVLPVANGGTGVTTSTGTGSTVLSTTPTFAGDVTLSTGNIVQGIAAKGVNFTANTPAAGMTNQLLNWYEEGAWTPSQGGNLSVSGSFSSTGRYTRIGRLVFVTAELNATTSLSVTAGGQACAGLPFNPAQVGVGSLIDNTLNQSGSVAAYANGLYSGSTTTSATGLILSATYTV